MNLLKKSDMNTITAKLIKDLEKIRDSLLAPWQKLDAIRTFIQLGLTYGLTYALRACPVTRASLTAYQTKLIQVLRSVCRLPNGSSISYFFADKSAGGLGLQDPFDERHVQKIVHTVKILSSTDPLIQKIAHGLAKREESHINPGMSILGLFLLAATVFAAFGQRLVPFLWDFILYIFITIFGQWSCFRFTGFPCHWLFSDFLGHASLDFLVTGFFAIFSVTILLDFSLGTLIE